MTAMHVALPKQAIPKVGQTIRFEGIAHRVTRVTWRTPTEDDLPLFGPGEEPEWEAAAICDMELTPEAKP